MNFFNNNCKICYLLVSKNSIITEQINKLLEFSKVLYKKRLSLLTHILVII